MEAALERIERRLESIETRLDRFAKGQTEYLGLDQLIERIPYSKKTIYNYVAEGSLIEGIHYVKKGRLIFYWPAMEAWLRGEQFGARIPKRRVRLK